MAIDEADDYQVYGSKIIYSYLWCNPIDGNATIHIYSQDLLKNLSFKAYPNDCRRLVLEFKRKNFVEFVERAEAQNQNFSITRTKQLFFEFKEKVADVLKSSSLNYSCFNGSCVVNVFYEFQNVVGGVKVETPFHIYYTKNNLSFTEHFYIGESESFDYYNNLYYADDVIKRKLKLFNKIPEEPKEEEQEEEQQQEQIIQDKTLSLKDKLLIFAFAVLIVLNLTWDFLRSKFAFAEEEEQEQEVRE